MDALVPVLVAMPLCAVFSKFSVSVACFPSLTCRESCHGLPLSLAWLSREAAGQLEPLKSAIL